MSHKLPLRYCYYTPSSKTKKNNHCFYALASLGLRTAPTPNTYQRLFYWSQDLHRLLTSKDPVSNINSDAIDSINHPSFLHQQRQQHQQAATTAVKGSRKKRQRETDSQTNTNSSCHYVQPRFLCCRGKGKQVSPARTPVHASTKRDDQLLQLLLQQQSITDYHCSNNSSFYCGDHSYCCRRSNLVATIALLH